MAKKDKFLLVILSLLIVTVLSGSFAYGFYYGKPGSPQPSADSHGQTMIEELEKKANANPNDLSSWEGLGNAYFDIGSSIRSRNSEEAKPYFAKAIEAYQHALSINNSKVSIITDMATALFYSDRAEEAEQAYKKAIETDPNYTKAHLNYGIFLHYVKNDQNGARKELTTALQLKPQAEENQMIQALLKEMGMSPSSEGRVPSYTTNIEPVVYQNCVLCHGPGGVRSDSPLNTYQGVMKFVDKTNPPDSPLLQKLKGGHVPTLSKETIDLIERWLKYGAPGPQ